MVPALGFCTYRQALSKSRKLFPVYHLQRNAIIVNAVNQKQEILKGAKNYSQFYFSREYVLQNDMLKKQRHEINQICHYHCVVSSGNLRQRNCLLKVTSPKQQYLFSVPQRQMSMEWLESLAITQAGWFKSLSESRLVEGTMTTIQAFHDYTHLPWWSSIIISTILIRSALTFPLGVYQKQIVAKIEKIKPEMTQMVQELKKETAYAVKKFGWDEAYARNMYNRSARKIWNDLIVRENCHPFKSTVMLWVQLPLWISMSVSFRNMATMMPHQDLPAQLIFLQLSTEGIGWIPNLTDVDHSLILPVAMGLINLLNIEVTALSKSRKGSRMVNISTNLFRIVSVAMIPVAAAVPSCMVLYWVTSSMCGLVHNLVLMHPRINKMVGMSSTAQQHQEPYRHLWVQMKNKFSRKKNAQD